MITNSKDTAGRFKNKGLKTSYKEKSYKTSYKDKKPKAPKKISERYLYNSGMAYLQRFPASSSHFKSVMMRKIYNSCRHHTDQNTEECAALLDALIIQFQNSKLLDDEAYLKAMVISLRKRGLSSLQISMKLQQKGFEKEDIKTAVKNHDTFEYDLNNEYDDNGDIYAALIFARKKRLGPYDVEKKRSPEKSLGIMARAGYSYDIAKKTLEIAPDDLEEKLKTLQFL